jgi:hypothetical protein
MTDAMRAIPGHPAERVTLAISGFGGEASLRPVLLDWFEFLGSRPGEVVYVDGGSARRTQRALVGLVQEGLIDRLELLNPAHWENDFTRCYIQEYRAGWLATKPYLCFIKMDTLAYRRGHDDWLLQDLSKLDDPRVFAMTNTHLMEAARGREGPYLVNDFVSLNYTLMKRGRWAASLREQIGDFIESGFRGEYPARIQCEPRYRRALIEWAWQAHVRHHGLVTLGRAESRDWMVYHVNKMDRKLLSLRARMRAGEDLDRHFDLPKGYYRPEPRGLSKLGRSIEGVVRRLKGQ